MVTLLWQTALLLIGAYFLGAFVGCMMRRLFSPGTRSVSAARATGGAATAGAVAATAAGGSERFAKALTGEGLVVQGSEHERVEPATQASKHIERVEPKIEAIAPTLPERTVSTAGLPAVSPPEVQPDVTRDVAARNSEAWSRASHVEGLAAAPPQAEKDTSPGAAIVGTATATAAALGAAAYARSAPGPVSRPNDLSDIRAIDQDVASRLNAAGIVRWEQIARWSADDVARHDVELGLGRRVTGENWVEQAAILAAGGSTAYAARRALSEADVVAAPAVGGWSPRIEPEQLPVASTPAESEWPDANETSAVATAAVATTAAAAATSFESVETVSEPETAAEPAGSFETTVDRRPFDLEDYPRAAGTTTSSVVSADIVSSQGDEMAVAPSEKRDADDTEAQRWRWDADQVPDDGEPSSDSGLASTEEGVSEPDTAGATIAGVGALAAGAIAATTEAPASQAAPEPVDEEPRSVESVVAPVAPAPVGVADEGEPITGLRSVRSQALVGERAMPLDSDDLKRIRGLGVRDETQLRAIGVATYSQIANWSDGDAAAVDDELRLGGRIAREHWIDQAKILESQTSSAPIERTDHGHEGIGTRVAATPIDPATLKVPPEKDPEPAKQSEPVAVSTPPIELPQVEDGEPRGGFSDQIEQVRPLGGDVTDNIVSAEPVAGRHDQSPATAFGATTAGAVTAMATGDETTVPAASSVEPEPPMVDASESGDDLKRIRGVGVLLENKLNAMGVHSYAQIANWTQEDIDQVSSKLAFQNRIEREKWIEQARILASGGHTEFSRRVDRNEL